MHRTIVRTFTAAAVSIAVIAATTLGVTGTAQADTGCLTDQGKALPDVLCANPGANPPIYHGPAGHQWHPTAAQLARCAVDAGALERRGGRVIGSGAALVKCGLDMLP